MLSENQSFLDEGATKTPKPPNWFNCEEGRSLDYIISQFDPQSNTLRGPGGHQNLSTTLLMIHKELKHTYY